MKKKTQKTRRQIVDENRKELKKIGLYQFLIEPEIQCFKKKPIRMSLKFIFSLLITYVFIIFLSAFAHDIYYCEAKDINLTNKYIEFQTEMHKLIDTQPELFMTYHLGQNIMHENKTLQWTPEKKLETKCNFNLIRWYNEPKHTLKYIKSTLPK